jgi:serine/threonine protein kinase
METIKSAFLQFESLTRISENQGHNIYQGPLRFDGRILTLQLVPVGEGDEDELDRKKRSVLGVIEGDFPGCPSWEDSGWIEIDSQPCFFLLSSPDTAISLGKFLREEQPSPERVISIFRKLGERLAPLHAAGFAHLALSPDTIAISSEDVVSFSAQGIGERSARLLNGHLRKGFDATSPYLAPESWEETASGDTRADVFALGTLFYEAISGTPPGGIPEPLSSFLPEEWHDLDTLVFRTMERDPEKRPSVSEIIERLAPKLPDPEPISLSSPNASPPYLLWALGGMIIAGILLIWIFR